MEFEQVKFLIETLTSPQIVFLLVIFWIVKFRPKVLERIATLDVAGVKLELRELKESVEKTKTEIEGVATRLDLVTEQYVEAAEQFDPLSKAKDIDKVGSDLKSYAASLDNIDFVLEHLELDADQAHVYGAGCAIQVRPQPKFLLPLSAFIADMAQSSNLKNIRLRVAYKLVQAMENILRCDNKKPESILDPDSREKARAALESLKLHQRSQQDFNANGTKSIVTRIERTLKLI